MIQVEALTKLYGEFVAVNELGFEVQPGEVMGLVGPNGAGKTTTLALPLGHHSADARQRPHLRT